MTNILSKELRDKMREHYSFLLSSEAHRICVLVRHAEAMDERVRAMEAQMERYISDAGDFHEKNDSLLDECAAVLKSAEMDGNDHCPECIQHIPEFGHAPDCRLAALLAKLEER